MSKKEKAIDKAIKNLVKLVDKHMDHFKNHPKQMAYIFWKYDRLHYAGRYLTPEQGWDNPKYAISDLGDKYEDEEIFGYQLSDIIYDAWGVSVSNESYPLDELDVEEIKKKSTKDPRFVELDNKENKTLDEWIEYLTNPLYEYHSLYSDRRNVEDNLLCTIGTGYEWNKDGYIILSGSADTSEILYNEYYLQGDNLPANIKTEFDQIMDHPQIKEAFQKAREKKEKYKKKKIEEERMKVKEFTEMFELKYPDLKEKLDYRDFDDFMDYIKAVEILYPERKKAKAQLFGEEDGDKTYYPICDYSLIVSIPDNAHSSYVEASIRISQEIIDNPKERSESKKYAKKVLAKLRKVRIENINN